MVCYNHHQISLFENIDNKDNNNKLDKVIDELKLTYGANIINKASLINNNIHKKDWFFIYIIKRYWN